MTFDKCRTMTSTKVVTSTHHIEVGKIGNPQATRAQGWWKDCEWRIPSVLELWVAATLATYTVYLQCTFSGTVCLVPISIYDLCIFHELNSRSICHHVKSIKEYGAIIENFFVAHSQGTGRLAQFKRYTNLLVFRHSDERQNIGTN